MVIIKPIKITSLGTSDTRFPIFLLWKANLVIKALDDPSLMKVIFHQVRIDPEQSFRHYQDDQLNPSTQIAPHLALDLILRLFKPALERLFVIMASVVCLSGLVTYTGTCRDTYINSCLAHFIKGGIFFWWVQQYKPPPLHELLHTYTHSIFMMRLWAQSTHTHTHRYGLLTWIRYLGAWSHCGWGWNQKPTRSGYVSPEMLECGLIFLYGVTNTWMERFGARKDEPYTIKQIQHISIAVMSVLTPHSVSTPHVFQQITFLTLSFPSPLGSGSEVWLVWCSNGSPFELFFFIIQTEQTQAGTRSPPCVSPSPVSWCPFTPRSTFSKWRYICFGVLSSYLPACSVGLPTSFDPGWLLKHRWRKPWPAYVSVAVVFSSSWA